jgi:hypothetical protein
MQTTKFEFNRNPIVIGKSIEQPSQDLIKATPSLFNASLDDAIKYGGPLTREAIGAMDLKFDRKYIIVDTKVHMLMPNMIPAIPNWHTDGVPRDANRMPDLFAQDEKTDSRFHLLVTGEGCLTEFINEKGPISLDVPADNSKALYSMVNEQTRELVTNPDSPYSTMRVPSCTATMFDWFTLHRGCKATMNEWRFLIRVTETDHRPPKTNLRDIIRTQTQVYTESNFGW